ncbi:anti-sigma factor [Occallatibacter riparius]|uniref:Regulator of SigK n=1 Tax=Occallatibacter riparius TaxID=1002689 RepID=A0A9J7BN18_9BACT|nr:anti-sigma factor [Occallatibacter riparius]UWZ83154.1 anti-sigma factor [Occallatibacter riparius]
MTDSIHIPQDDLALYAMRALSPEEAAQVRAHVDACAECREELAALSGDLAAVAMSVEQQELPAGARERFLNRIAADARTDSQSAPTPAARGSVVSIDSAPRRSARPSWIAWGAVAAMLVIAAGLELRVRFLRGQVALQARVIEQQQQANAKAQMVMDLLKDPTAQHVMLTAAKSKPAPMAKTVYMASKGALLMQASNLDPLPSNKTYELWVIPMKGAPMPAGMFKPDAAGNASVVMPDMPKGIEAKAFGVTIENAGGSATPTMPIVLAGAAPAAGL